MDEINVTFVQLRVRFLSLNVFLKLLYYGCLMRLRVSPIFSVANVCAASQLTDRLEEAA